MRQFYPNRGATLNDAVLSADADRATARTLTPRSRRPSEPTLRWLRGGFGRVGPAAFAALSSGRERFVMLEVFATEAAAASWSDDFQFMAGSIDAGDL